MRKRLEKEIKQYPAPRVHAPAHPEAERGYVTLKKTTLRMNSDTYSVIPANAILHSWPLTPSVDKD